MGFELNKLLRRNSFFSDIYAVFYSANVAAGPWLMSSVTLILLQILLPKGRSEFTISALIYTFIFSTIIYGGFSTSVTRYLSDLIYRKEYGKIYLFYKDTIVYAASFSSLFVILFWVINHPLNLVKLLLFLQSMILLTVIWVQLTFVTSIRKFSPVIVAFLSGSLLSLMFCTAWNKFSEALGYFGYNLGLMIIGTVLQFSIKKFLSTTNSEQRESLFVKAIKVYPKQAITGFLVYLAAWVDDFIAWYHFRYSPAKGFVFAPEYDLPMFFSYLFIIPTMILFVLNLETEFYESYRVFYRSIEENRPLRYINIARSTMDNNLWASTKIVMSVQVSFTIAGLVTSNYVSKLLGFSEYSSTALRFGLIGAAANGLFLYFALISYYYDLPDIPLFGSLIAFSINLGTSPFLLKRLPGFGFAAAFVISTIFIYRRFKKVYDDILRFEFNRTKLNLPKREVIVHENR
ncbi:exopolysaccharide Pel transporter PelG [Fervidobacterium thailandense]|uniref:exopolysaccharide Pel transporter PelG n=1 Tax=Fervidobacterium thailandense TaxID=1008305 RepID=UPI00355BF34F